MRGKKYATKKKWKPREGLKFLLQVPDRQIMVAPLRPLVYQGSRAIEESNPVVHVEAIKRSLQPAMQYVVGDGLALWENFWDI